MDNLIKNALPRWIFISIIGIAGMAVTTGLGWIGYELRGHNDRLINLQINQGMLLKKEGIKPIKNADEIIQEEAKAD